MALLPVSQWRQSALKMAFLLVAAGLLTALTWIGWLRLRPSLSTLTPDERQRLVQEALLESPTVFQPAWFEPRIGYTLQPGARLTAWNDTFVANRLGYRTHPPRKAKGTYRVVFLGDSWTYGMGISWRDSFPMRFERLANDRRPLGAPRVEAWTLALPGYNTLNELAALELYFDRLHPDAVVLCPTRNDIDSSNAVTPEGMLARPRAERDDFGDPFGYRFLTPLVDAPSFHRRWRQAFGAVARMERDLQRRGVPLFLFFAATWQDALAHALVAESAIRSPYAITPSALTLGKWRNPPPFGHGTREANFLYGRLAYQLVAGELGWPSLAEERGSPLHLAERIFRSPPGLEWLRASEAAAREATESVPVSYVPGPAATPQCLAAMDCETGVAPRAATFLVRREPGATEVVVSAARLPDPTWLYPLTVQVRVADETEVVSGSFTLPRNGPPGSRYRLRIPHGRSAALEVTLLAERATATADVPTGRSFVVQGIEQR